MEKGTLVSTDGRTFTTNRIFEYDIYDIDGTKYKNIKRGVNFGTKKTTTRGLSQFDVIKNRSWAGKFLAATKFLGFLAEGYGGARALVTGDINEMNPLEIVVNDMVEKTDEFYLGVTDEIVNKTLNLGSKSLHDLFSSNKFVQNNYLLEGASFETLYGIFKGDITNYNQLLESISNSNNTDIDLLFKKDGNDNLQLKSVLIRGDSN